MSEDLGKPEGLADRLRTAIGDFFVEFTRFESLYVNVAIGTLTNDAQLVEHIGELLELEKRMKLLRRMAEERSVSRVLMADLKTALNRGKKLAEQRNVIAHNTATIAFHGMQEGYVTSMTAGIKLPKSQRKRPSKPASTPEERKALMESWLMNIEDIQRFTRDAIDLNRTMVGIIERLDKHRRGITGANI